MKTKLLSKAGIALIMSAAACSIFFSQHAFAQGGAESGFSGLIGRDRIGPDDPRFQPAAALVLHEATNATIGKPKGWAFFSKTVITNYIQEKVVYEPRSVGRVAEPRSLTPTEAVFLEELFSHDLKRARGVEITKDGFSGNIRPQDVDVKPADLQAKAKARGEAKSKWYGQGAQGLGPG